MKILNWKTNEVILDRPKMRFQLADLRGINLRFADLNSRNLSGADLRGVCLRQANLRRVKMVGTNLEGADLRGANLTSADLRDANLASANLSRAFVIGVTFNQTIFTTTNFYRTTLGYCNFLSCDTLHHALRIENIRHYGPSALDLYTLRSSVAHLPIVFLEGVGYLREDTERLLTMFEGNKHNYVSCFISHANADSAFVERLYQDLRANKVNCWHYAYDMLGGRDWRDQIVEAIKKHDKLILVCSRRSIYRPTVVMEILQAIDDERAAGVQKLFPIRLDNHILDEKTIDEAREKVRSGEWRENWVYYVTRYHIPDFSNWEIENTYQVEVRKLLKALESPDKRG